MNIKQQKNSSLILGIIFVIPLIFISIQSSRVEAKTSPFNNVRFLIKPKLFIEQTYNDNLLSSETAAKSSWGSTLSPSLKLELLKGSHSLSTFYQANKTVYINSREDDFLDHNLRGDMSVQFSSRSKIDFFASYQRGHENRGTGFSRGIGEQLYKPDKTRYYHTGTTISYGTDQSQGRLVVAINATAKRLDGRSIAERLANQNSYNGSLTFVYMARPNTSLLIEAHRAKHVYGSLNEAESLDNTENRLYLGSHWKVTALTTGKAKIGVIKKQFDLQEKDTFTGIGWEIGINWSPIQDTWLELTTLAQTEENTGAGDYTRTIEVSSALTQQWNPNFQTTLFAGAMKNAFFPTQQEEGLWSISIAFDYQIHRRAKLSSEISHQEQLSTTKGQDFQRTIYSIRLLLNY